MLPGDLLLVCDLPFDRADFPGLCAKGEESKDSRDDCTVFSPAGQLCSLIRSTGITHLALPWALGGYEYGGAINQIFHGWVGDVRIVNRPLPASEFMLYQ